MITLFPLPSSLHPYIRLGLFGSKCYVIHREQADRQASQPPPSSWNGKACQPGSKSSTGFVGVSVFPEWNLFVMSLVCLIAVVVAGTSFCSFNLRPVHPFLPPLPCHASPFLLPLFPVSAIQPKLYYGKHKKWRADIFSFRFSRTIITSPSFTREIINRDKKWLRITSAW